MKDALTDGVKPGHAVVIDAKGLPAAERVNLFTCCVRAL